MILKKFVYNLQTLLNLKIQYEESAKNELGVAMQKLENEKQILVMMQQEKENLIEEIKIITKQGALVSKIKEYSLYLKTLKNNLEKQLNTIKFCTENVDITREKMIKVIKEREILDKLREKKFASYTKELHNSEQKAVDELVGYNYFEDKINKGDSNGSKN